VLCPPATTWSAPCDIEHRVEMNRLERVALLGLASLLIVACSGAGGGGHGGATGSAGVPGNGGTTSTGGHSGSGGGTGGSGGRAGSSGATGGSVHDGGHDMSVGTCLSDSDCPSGATCLSLGEGLCGHTCTGVIVPCSTDSDCAPDAAVPLICGFEGCGCSPTGMECKPGCLTDADCGLAVCAPNHRCVQRPCGPGAPACPPNTICAGVMPHTTCESIYCTSNSQCSDYCVAQTCQSVPGQCAFPPP
jgi:hypothetical protein